MTTITAVDKKRKDNVDTNKEQLKNGAAVDEEKTEELNEGKNKKPGFENNSINVGTVRNKVETINDYVDRIDKNIIQPICDREAKRLNEICEELKRLNDEARKSGIKIDDAKLEVLLLDLIIEIDDLAERIEKRALDVDIAEAFLTENLNRALLHANEVREKKNLTNADLQKAYAKNLVLPDKYTHLVKNRIYKRLEARVNSAEKMFYGIKAILSRRL